jgi:hypothetical protein
MKEKLSEKRKQMTNTTPRTAFEQRPHAHNKPREGIYS